MRWIAKIPGLDTPLRRGLVFGFGLVAFMTLCCLPTLSQLATRPSAELLRYMAGIGGTFLIAYAIEVPAVVRAPRNPRRESLVGGIVGVGWCGLLAIVASLGLGERSAVDHWIWADDLAFAFAGSSLLLLGISIVLQPLFTYEFQGIEHYNADD